MKSTHIFIVSILTLTKFAQANENITFYALLFNNVLLFWSWYGKRLFWFKLSKIFEYIK